MRFIIVIAFFFVTGSHISYGQKMVEQVNIVDKPEISWGNYLPGRMKADSFKVQNRIMLPEDYFEDYFLKKATLYFCGANFSVVEKLVLYSQDITEVKEAINKCVPGTMVILEKILVGYKKDQELFLNNASFLLY